LAVPAAMTSATVAQGSHPDDSDTSISDNSKTDNSVETTDDDISNIAPAGDKREENFEFRPPCPLPLQLFQEHFTLSACSKCQRTGLQCSPIDVNTPIRAWWEIFKNTLLDKIVCYTNDYGGAKAKHWKDIERKDLEAFIAVLFVSAIQKRKDKPSN
jgi:hypothetical protein